MADAHISRHGLYGETAGALRPEFIHLEPISERSGRHGWTIAPHSHPGIVQLLLVATGGGTLTADAETVNLGPGALIFLPAGSVHAFRFDPGTEGWVLSIAADLLSDARLSALEGSRLTAASTPRWINPVPHAPHIPRLAALLADLANALSGASRNHPPPSCLVQACLVLCLAGEAMDGADAEAGPARSASLPRRFQALVEREYRSGWSVDRYAAALGASAPTLTRACRAATGKPPGEIVLDRLLLESMRALTFTSEPVAGIATSLGFSDPAYFARFFKARTGMTASIFRKQGGWFKG